MNGLHFAAQVASGYFDPPDGMLLWMSPRAVKGRIYTTVGTHKFDNGVIRITVLPGTKTDLASIPWFLRWAFSPTGPWQRAAVFHDRGCEQATTPEERHLADVIFRSMCRLDGVNKFTAWVLYVGVRIGAWHWQLTRRKKP